MKKRAILFAGGVDSQYNFPRYENDLRLAYSVLLEKLNYYRDDISIFLGYGKPMVYNDQKIKTHIAYKNLLINELDAMSKELGEEDCLVLVVSNHGAEGPFINMWGSEYLSLDEFEVLIKEIKAKKLLIMGQCYGGDFSNLKLDNTCIITANQPNLVSYAHYPDNKYDEFLYLFFSFLYGEYPDTSFIIEKAEKDIGKAFAFAYENDQYNPHGICYNSHLKIDGNNLVECPVIKNNIENINIFIQ